MKKLRRARVGSAHVIAVIALVLAVTGTAVALPGSSKIDKNDIKKNAVNSADIKNNSVSGLDLKNGNATGTDVKDGSLGGADIDESSLGEVPSAAHAKTADSANTANTAGIAAKTSQIVNIFDVGNPGDPTQTILELGGLKLTTKCDSQNEIEATTSVSNSLIDFLTGQDSDYLVDEDFDVGEAFDADDGHDQGYTEMFYLHYTRPDGVNVIVTLHDVDGMEANPVFPGSSQQAECLVAGTATVSSL